MSAINPASAPFQPLSPSSVQSAPSSKKTEPAQSQQTQQTDDSAAQVPIAPQDSSAASTHQESNFEPGALHFSGSPSEPSFTPLASQSAPSRAEIQASADDNLAQLRNKRIEGRLSQLAEEQLRLIKDVHQP